MNEPDPEEERGRSSDQDDSEAIRDESPTPRLDDTYIEKSKNAFERGIINCYEGREDFNNGETSIETVTQALVAQTLENAGQLPRLADALSFGYFSKAGELFNCVPRAAGTGVRHGVRDVSGNQRLAQNCGDIVCAVVGLLNPNKLLAPFQIIKEAANLGGKALKTTRTLEALSLEVHVSVNAEGKALKALDLAEGGKKPGLNIRPGQEWKLKIQGNAQNTKTPGHGLESAKEAIRQAKDPMIGDVYLDNGYHKALRKMGVDVRLAHNRRPDVLAVSTDGKLMRAIEVQSKSDREMILMNRNIKVAEQLKPLDIDVKVKIKQIPSWDYEKGIPKK